MATRTSRTEANPPTYEPGCAILKCGATEKVTQCARCKFFAFCADHQKGNKHPCMPAFPDQGSGLPSSEFWMTTLRMHLVSYPTQPPTFDLRLNLGSESACLERPPTGRSTKWGNRIAALRSAARDYAERQAANGNSHSVLNPTLLVEVTSKPHDPRFSAIVQMKASKTRVEIEIPRPDFHVSKPDTTTSFTQLTVPEHWGDAVEAGPPKGTLRLTETPKMPLEARAKSSTPTLKMPLEARAKSSTPEPPDSFERIEIPDRLIVAGFSDQVFGQRFWHYGSCVMCGIRDPSVTACQKCDLLLHPGCTSAHRPNCALTHPKGPEEGTDVPVEQIANYLCGVDSQGFSIVYAPLPQTHWWLINPDEIGEHIAGDFGSRVASLVKVFGPNLGEHLIVVTDGEPRQQKVFVLTKVGQDSSSCAIM